MNFTRVMYTWVCSGIKDKNQVSAEKVLFLENGVVQVTCKDINNRISEETLTIKEFTERFNFDLAFEISVQRQADAM